MHVSKDCQINECLTYGYSLHNFDCFGAYAFCHFRYIFEVGHIPQKVNDKVCVLILSFSFPR